MARIDGREAAREAVMQATQLAAAAAYRAPQLTGRLEIQTEVITDEDQDPIIEFAGTLAPISPVMAFDYQTMKHFREKEAALNVLLIGANLSHSELGWDCGACGFATCGEFNKWSKEHGGPATLWGGPSCVWKTMDWAAACDFASAAAYQYRVDCRAMATIGAACGGVGYLPECSARVAVLIGPPGDFIYFSRKQNRDAFPLEDQREALLRTSPTNWLSFPGSNNPSVKSRDDWWNNPDYPSWGPMSPEQLKFVEETMAKVGAVAQEYIPKVTSWYKKHE
jgi:uncharacterized ferredoxin-like protein